MTLRVVGLSYRTAPLALRESFAVAPRELQSVVRRLAEALSAETVVLSTCNRLEVYYASPRPLLTASAVFAGLLPGTRTARYVSPENPEHLLYQHDGSEAVRHLFRVAAGLDSMILGESEIAAQIKQAYSTASEAGTAGRVLNRLFQKALHSVKIVRSNTRIAQGSASIGSVVARLAAQTFGEALPACRALLWGAGKAAEATTRHLMAAGISKLWIVNRTPAKAQELATSCDASWLAWEQAIRQLEHVDIAIVCTQAPHYLIEPADLEPVLPRRGGRPLCLIDLAVPRNIDPAVGGLPSVRLSNIDDLQAIARAGLAARQQELAACDALIERQAQHFMRWHDAGANKQQEDTAACLETVCGS